MEDYSREIKGNEWDPGKSCKTLSLLWSDKWSCVFIAYWVCTAVCASGLSGDITQPSIECERICTYITVHTQQPFYYLSWNCGYPS